MSHAITPPASDVEYVLGLPADRQAAVLSALLRRLVGDCADAKVPVAATDGQRTLPLGTFAPDAETVRYLAFIDTLSPDAREMMTRPLPRDFDPDDSLTLEELRALRAKRPSVPRRSEPATPDAGQPATSATATSG